MYLQLAEKPKTYPVKGYHRTANRVGPYKRRYMSEEDADADNPYIFIPDPAGETSGYYVREDYFDFMDADEYAEFIVFVAPYQPEVAGGGMSEDMFLSKKADRKARRETRGEKKQLKNEKTKAKIALKNAKASGIENGTWDGGSGKEIFGSVLDTVQGIFGHGAEITDDGGPGAVPPSKEPAYSFWDNTTFGINNKLVVGLAVAAAVVGGVVISRKRKKRK